MPQNMGGGRPESCQANLNGCVGTVPDCGLDEAAKYAILKACMEKWFTKIESKWEVPKGCTCLYIGGPTGVLRANSPECSLHDMETITGSLTPEEIVALIYCEVSGRRNRTN